MKFSAEDIVAAMKAAKASPDTVDATLKHLATVEEELKAEKDTTKRPKKQLVGVIVEDDVPEEGVEQRLFVVQINSDANHNEVLANLRNAAGEHNGAAAKKKVEIRTFSDVFAYLKAKFIRKFDMKIMTKEPIIILRTKDVF